ncbi:MAG: TetR/AcrR family transcriptional regulator [Salibacteraceae bacterium]
MPRSKAFDESVVLEKAVNLFWKNGYHATSMQDLVEHLGINRASLYGTYGDKKTLFQKAFQRYRRDSISQVKAFLASEENVKEGLFRLMLGACNETMCDPERKGCFSVNTTTELVPNDPEIKTVLMENRKRLETIFEAYLQQGVDRGQINSGKDLKSIATHLFTFYNGLQIISKVADDPDHLQSALTVALSVLDD